MKNYQLKSRRSKGQQSALVLIMLVAIGAAGFIISGRIGIVAGQNRPDKIEYGVIYSCPEMSNYEFKVISCDDKNWCQVFIANKFAPHGGNITGEGKDAVLSLMRKGECTVKGRPPVADEKTEPAKTRDRADDGDKQTPNGDQKPENAGLCASDPSLKVKPKPNDSMELNSKRAILARFQQAVDKGEKVAVGITFDSFQIGPPRANLRGSTLYLEDAPVGAKLYPVKTNFTLCSLFSTEIMRDVTDGRFECFKDNFGEWVCATGTGYRTVKTTYEKIKK